MFKDNGTVNGSQSTLRAEKPECTAAAQRVSLEQQERPRAT